MHWLAHIFGLDNASGGWYLFWSGICGDLALIGGTATLYHKHTCHAPRCARIAKHQVEGTPWCTRHHPRGICGSDTHGK